MSRTEIKCSTALLVLISCFYSAMYTLCPKNGTRVILNILYSCTSVAMKFSMLYPDAFS